MRPVGRVLGHGSRRADIVIEHVLTYIGVPVGNSHQRGSGRSRPRRERGTRRVQYRLAVLVVHTVMAGHGIPAGPVFRRGYAVDGDATSPSRCLVIAVALGSSLSRATGGVVDRGAWNGPFVILRTGAIVGLVQASVDSMVRSPLVVMVMCVSFIVMLPNIRVFRPPLGKVVNLCNVLAGLHRNTSSQNWPMSEGFGWAGPVGPSVPLSVWFPVLFPVWFPALSSVPLSVLLPVSFRVLPFIWVPSSV